MSTERGQEMSLRAIGTEPVAARDGEARLGAARQLVTFTVADGEYGVDILAVREIKGWTPVTRLPNAPSWVRGILNLRGTILPIVDLRARFGAGDTDATTTHAVIVVGLAERMIGLLVDSVSDIATVPIADITPVPVDAVRVGTDLFEGLASLGAGRMVALIDLPAVVADAAADEPRPLAVAS